MIKSDFHTQYIPLGRVKLEFVVIPKPMKLRPACNGAYNNLVGLSSPQTFQRPGIDSRRHGLGGFRCGGRQ